MARSVGLWLPLLLLFLLSVELSMADNADEHHIPQSDFSDVMHHDESHDSHLTHHVDTSLEPPHDAHDPHDVHNVHGLLPHVSVDHLPPFEHEHEHDHLDSVHLNSSHFNATSHNFTRNHSKPIELIALEAAVAAKATISAAQAASSVVRTNPHRLADSAPCPPQTQSDYELLMPALEDLDIAFGYMFSVASMFLYMPQLITIIQRRSTFGLSISTIVLAALSSVSSFFTVFILDYYLIEGCSVIGTHCIPYIQPFLQACFNISIIVPLYIVALYIYVQYDYNNPELIEALEKDPEHGPVFALGLPKRKYYELMSLIFVTLACTGIFLFLLTALGVCSKITRFYGRGQGVLSSLFTAMQWVPQIIMTLDLKEKGSLNLTTLLAFATLDVCSIIYLLRLKQDWSIWVQNAIDLVFVSTLIMCVLYFEATPRHHRKAGPEDASLISSDERRYYSDQSTNLVITPGTVSQQRARIESMIKPTSTRKPSGRLRSGDRSGL